MLSVASKKPDKSGVRICTGDCSRELTGQRVVDQIAYDFTPRVERARGLASGGLRILVIGGKEVFKDLAEEFGVKRDLLIKWRVLLDRELVAVKNINQSPHLDAAESSVVVNG